MLVAVQLSVPGLYLPPVFKGGGLITTPPQTIISLPVQTAVCSVGQTARWWCWWLSNYPCWDCICHRCSTGGSNGNPPQTIISFPVQTAVCRLRASGALAVLVAVQLSVPGLYLPQAFGSYHKTAPNNHFTASPDCRVKLSGGRSVGVQVQSTYHRYMEDIRYRKSREEYRQPALTVVATDIVRSASALRGFNVPSLVLRRQIGD